MFFSRGLGLVWPPLVATPGLAAGAFCCWLEHLDVVCVIKNRKTELHDGFDFFLSTQIAQPDPPGMDLQIKFGGSAGVKLPKLKLCFASALSPNPRSRPYRNQKRGRLIY